MNYKNIMTEAIHEFYNSHVILIFSKIHESHKYINDFHEFNCHLNSPGKNY